jgi:3-oxoacyl-[acyl-carrier-protein] synthase I
MTDVFVIADNIFSPLGSTSAENFMQLKQAVSGIKKQDNAGMSEKPFYAALFNNENQLASTSTKDHYTRFEKILIASVSNAIKDSSADITGNKTVLIISSTKGNVSLLETESYNEVLRNRMALHTSASLVAKHFNFAHIPVVISNACISGLLAILTGMRLIQSGQYQNAVVVGADVISKFVLSGFQSFNAVSDEICKPFDAARNGINLGEGAATVILSANKKNTEDVKIAGGSTSNDANHISGPSRTGQELHYAIENALKRANLPAQAIDFISAHGTATVFNDEMEAKAITLSNLQNAPVNSLKGYYGHTLGAAGVIESVISIHSLKQNVVIPTLGFKNMGVTKPVNVCTRLHEAPLKNFLKTASGFGGCNAALIFSK